MFLCHQIGPLCPCLSVQKMDLHVGHCGRSTFGGKSMHALKIGTIETDAFQGVLCP